MADFEFGLVDEPLETPPPGAPAVLEQNTAHEEQAISLLIPFFRQGPRNREVLGAVVEQVQDLEDAIWSLYDAFDLESATGNRLDLVGKILNERRANRTDEQYRTFLRAVVLANRSTGRRDALYAVMLAMDADSEPALRDIYPATIEATMATTGDALPADVVLLLRRAKAGGVKLFLVVGPPVDETSIVGDVDGSPEGFIISSVF